MSEHTTRTTEVPLPNCPDTPEIPTNGTAVTVYEFDGGNVRVQSNISTSLTGRTSKSWEVVYRPDYEGTVPKHQTVADFEDRDDAENFAKKFIAGDTEPKRELVPFFLGKNAATLKSVKSGHYVWMDETAGEAGEARNYRVIKYRDSTWGVLKSEVVPRGEARLHVLADDRIQEKGTREEAIEALRQRMVE